MAKHIYVIAGEASGDFLGAQLMRALKKQAPDTVFSGIGGTQMQGQGLKSLFPMEELSVMGVWEILPKIFHLLKRIKQAARDIADKKPDMVVTIDAPDFSFRVVKAVRKQSKVPPKFVHYVAPTVWAWRPGRAKKIAAFLDVLICLFDFEPPYFEKEGLKAIAVGHPMMENGLEEAKPAVIGDKDKLKLGVFFGSRQGEIKRLAPVLLEVIEKIIAEERHIELIVPTLPHLEEKISALLSNVSVPVHISTDHTNKWAVFKACDVAVAVSGTVGLELAAANVPHVIAYKMSPVTWAIVRRVIKTPFAHLANIIAKYEIVPEFIQGECTADDVASEVLALIDDKTLRQEQCDAFDDIRTHIGGATPPSDKAAEFLLTSVSS